MSTFKSLDEELELDESDIEARLRAYSLEDPDEPMPDVDSDDDHSSVGEKRKLCVFNILHLERADREKVMEMTRDRARGHGGPRRQIPNTESSSGGT